MAAFAGFTRYSPESTMPAAVLAFAIDGLETCRFEDGPELLKLTLRAAGAGTWACDLRTGQSLWSEETFALLGVDSTLLSPSFDSWLDLVHPDDRADAQAAVDKALREKASLELDHRVVTPAGQVRWLSAKGRAVYSASGVPLRLVGVVFDVTARRATEDLLRFREQQLAAITDGVPALISYVDAEQRYRFNNRVYEEWFGVSRDALCGRHVRDVVGDAAYAEIRPHLERALGGEDVRFEARLPYAGVGLRDVEVRYVPHRDATSQVLGCFVLVHDVSDYKRIEQQLRQERELASQLIETSSAAIFIKDLEGRYLLANPRTCNNLGRPLNEILGRTDRQLLPRDIASRFEETDALTLRFGQSVDREETLADASGKVRTFICTKFPLHGPDGKPIALCGVATDISERKRTEIALLSANRQYVAIEGALRESEEAARARSNELSTLLDATPAIVWIAHDPDCSVVTGSRATHTMSKTRPGTNLSRTPAGAGELAPYRVLREGRELTLEELPLRRAARGDTLEHFEMQLAFPDGEVVDLLGSAVPLKDARGALRGAIAACVDITKHKRSEAALEDRSEQLRIVVEALRESDRRKDEFLAVLGHELRSPLSAIRNAVRVLHTHAPAGPLERVAGIIDRQSGQLVRLTEDLLDVARIAHGKIELRRERIDVRAFLHHAVETSRPLLDAGGHQFVMRVPETPLYVFGDMGRLCQSVSNLLNNAAKYSPPATRIELSAEAMGGQLAIRVRDEGIGFDAQTQAHLFQPFSQADDAYRRAQGGLGIGLALTKVLIELHGGTVSGESPGPGRGSEFMVMLPLMNDAP